MRSTIFAALAAAVCVLAASAQAAQSWGLIGEEEARFEAEVVDVLCELTGDCPADCGDGERQLGLLQDDGTLIMPLKNQVPFAGAAAELLAYCGARVVADGLFANNRGHRVFALQFVRKAPEGDWHRADRFLENWAEAHGVAADSKEAKTWFRHDPRIQRLIERDGKLGLGPAADEDVLSGE